MESRRSDPVDVLLNLGFGGGDKGNDGISRIPARFLKPSEVILFLFYKFFLFILILQKL